MNAASVALDIIAFARESFPEFFAELREDEITELTGITQRMIDFGIQFSFTDAQSRLALKIAMMREYNTFRLLILDRMIAERKHNTERVFGFIGKAIGVLVLAVPLVVASATGGSDVTA